MKTITLHALFRGIVDFFLDMDRERRSSDLSVTLADTLFRMENEVTMAFARLAHGRRLRTMLGLFVTTLLVSAVLQADTARPCRELRVMRSAHVLLHTDLSEQSAQDLLARMETTLDEVSDYWQRPVRGLIECYIVDDLANWPDSALPHPTARLIVEQIGGITLFDERGAGIHAHKQATIVAASRPGVAEHEAVHAFCVHAFGTTGPGWYREGIAQVFAYAQGEPSGLHCPAEIRFELISAVPKPLCDVVRGTGFTERLSQSLANKMRDHQDLAGLIPTSNWTDHDVQELDLLKTEYAWSWLACYLLHHNPNYQARFKQLGQGYLANREDWFDTLYGPVFDRLSFEFAFTVDHFTPGYRVDLCHWDWNKRFRCVSDGRAVRARIAAARGYQASGLLVKEGVQYRIGTEGEWSTGASQPATDAQGDDKGRGSLEAVVMRDYLLSAPVALPGNGRFHAPCDGQLYLRCRDDWSELGDNTGSIVVTLSRPTH